ncbi:TM2 domain-containing protein [bacterium]|nr:TM2 domain-containing protein [bacterium]
MNEQTGDTVPSGEKKRMAAGIIAILFGALGLHKFYLGYLVEGIIVILLLIISQMDLALFLMVLGVVEGILYLTKSDEEFKATYLTARKPWL